MNILSSFTTFITAILVFSVLVVIHEFGHFIFAKLSGIKVEEFAVGMGPKVLSTKRGETVFSIRAFPLGGFCKMLGEDESNKDPRAFNNKPVYKRIAVILFGPIANLILTVLLLAIMVVQLPLVESVLPGKPAEAAGLQKGDTIVAIGGKAIKQLTDVNAMLSQSIGKAVDVQVERNKELLDLEVVPAYDTENNRAIIGISMSAVMKVEGYSMAGGVRNTLGALREMGMFFRGLFRNKDVAKDVIGFVGIVDLIGKSAKLGWIYVANLTAIISLNLFVFNLLPIPALDGGRLVFLVVEGIRRKPVDPDKEGMVHFIGFVLLMILSVFIIYNDLIRMNILKF